MAPWLRHLSVLMVLSTLTGCGGGTSNDAELVLERHSVNISAGNGDGPPAEERIQFSWKGNATYIAALLLNETSVPSWLTLQIDQYSVTVKVTNTFIRAGNYQIPIRIALLDGDRKVLAYDDFLLTYNLRPRFTTQITSLEFTHVQMGTPPPAQVVQILGGGEDWVASADQPWVTFSRGAGSAPTEVQVGVNIAGLPAGSYTAEASFEDAAGGQVITIPVSLRITSPLFEVSPSRVEFTIKNGQFANDGVVVTSNSGAPVNWSASADVPWLTLSPTAGTTYSVATIGLKHDHGLWAGDYSGRVTFTADYGGVPLTAKADVILHVDPPSFAVTEHHLSSGSNYGALITPKVLIGKINDEIASPWPWTIEFSGEGSQWLKADKVSGNSSAPMVTLDADWANIPAGDYAPAVTMKAFVNGDTVSKTVNVVLRAAPHEIYPERVGAAFVKTPSISRLTSSIVVRDNYRISDTPWTAVSDKEWLMVTAAGTTGGTLVLVADPSGLAEGQMHYANVTLSAPNTTVVNSPTIRVGLWKDGTDPLEEISVAGSFSEAVTDPIRPYAYLHGGDGEVTVLNLYTGATVGSVATGGTTLGAMAVSGDGSQLFITDTANGQLLSVSLDTWATTVADASFPSAGSKQMAFLQPAGHGMLVTTDGQAYDEAGELVGSHPFVDQHLAVSTTSGHLCGVAPSGGSAGCKHTWYTPFVAPPFSVLTDRSITAVDNSTWKDVATDSDGRMAFFVSASKVYVWDASGMVGEFLPIANANNVEEGPDDTVVFGASNSGVNRLFFYSSAGESLGSTLLSTEGSLFDESLRVSGDGRRSIVLTNEPSAVIVGAP